MVALIQGTDRNGAHLAAGLVGYALGIIPSHIMAMGRGSIEATRARQVAMYLAHVGFGMSLARVASAFGRDRSTVAHGCHLIEGRREDPEFDAWLETLELGIGVLAPLNVEEEGAEG